MQLKRLGRLQSPWRVHAGARPSCRHMAVEVAEELGGRHEAEIKAAVLDEFIDSPGGREGEEDATA